MSFCSICGSKAKEESNFCSDCGAKILTEKNTKKSSEEELHKKIDDAGSTKPKIVERVIEREYHKEKSSNTSFIWFILILAIFAFLMIQGGVLDEAAKGSGVPYVDPCVRAFEECNYECGEGLLSTVCKEKCSYDYRKCKNE